MVVGVIFFFFALVLTYFCTMQWHVAVQDSTGRTAATRGVPCDKGVFSQDHREGHPFIQYPFIQYVVKSVDCEPSVRVV